MKSTIETYILIMQWILSGKSCVRTETVSLKTRNIGGESHGSLGYDFKNYCLNNEPSVIYTLLNKII